MLAAVEIADLQTLKQPVKVCLPTHSLSLSLAADQLESDRPLDAIVRVAPKRHK